MIFTSLIFALNTSSLLVSLLISVISGFEHRKALEILICVVTGIVLVSLTARNSIGGYDILSGDAVKVLVPTILFLLVTQIEDVFYFCIAIYFLQAFSLFSFISKSEDRQQVSAAQRKRVRYQSYHRG